MKKIDWRTQLAFFFLVIFLVTIPIISVPTTASANAIANITDDPDPCLISASGADLGIKAADTAVETTNATVSVPVNNASEYFQLLNIQSSVCATRKATIAQRDKTIGITIFGIPTPGTSWDAILKALMKIVMNKLTDSTVKWINSGFNGNPLFITNPAGYFSNIANGFAGNFINQLAGSNLCSPFKASVVLALQQYSATNATAGTYNPQCTLTGIGHNLEDFYTNFSKGGGWDTWFSMTQNNSNNPYGSYLDAQDQLNLGIASNVNTKTLEANWAKGFLSTQQCLGTTDSNGNCIGPTQTITPGAVIETQLESVLGQGVSDLGLARSFDDVVSALVGALTKKVFTSADGLFSANSGSGGYSSSGNGTYDTGPTNFGSSGGNPASSVSCSPDKTSALIGDTVTWTATAPQVDGISFSYDWSGDEVSAGNSNATLFQQYTTEGTKNAEVTVTSVQNAVGGTATSTQTSTVICSPSVDISEYSPLQVTCSASVTHIAINTNVIWTATISGGSGKFTEIHWDGSQQVVPGTNNVFMFPSDLPDPTVPLYTWPWYATPATHGDTIQTFKNNGDGTMTDTLQRVYLHSNAGKLGDVSTDVTVEDIDPQLKPVDAQCGSVLIDELN
jgi:hypothetical protein